jgi:Protein of unknown function (DUF4019)
MKLSYLALVLCFFATPSFAAPSSDDAVSAAKSWLAVVDDKNYPQSWKDAAELFQQGISEVKWDGMVKSVRERLGALKSRSFQDVQLTKTLPGVPDGDYAVTSFHASFDSKADATEVVTLILENGKWKVGGYFIK